MSIQEEINNLKNERKELFREMADNSHALAEARKNGDTARVQELERKKVEMQGNAVRMDEEIKQKEAERIAILKGKKDGGGGGDMDSAVNRDPNRQDQENQDKQQTNTLDEERKKAIARQWQEDIDRQMREKQEKERKAAMMKAYRERSR